LEDVVKNLPLNVINNTINTTTTIATTHTTITINSGLRFIL